MTSRAAGRCVGPGRSRRTDRMTAAMPITHTRYCGDSTRLVATRKSTVVRAAS